MWSTIIGNHQKINKVSRKKLSDLTSIKHFPSNKQLRYFEGTRGPDGIKVKSPGQNEPHAFYDPFDPDDDLLIEAINQHYENLVRELKAKNTEKAAFEASWLSHSLVDGMTPAHHYPYEEELESLNADKTTSKKLGDSAKLRKKVISAKGDTMFESVQNNWRIYGAKGLLITHSSFEGGVAFITQPLTFNKLEITKNDIAKAKEMGIDEYFKSAAREVALLNMYEEYYRYGWTVRLSRQVRDELMPMIIKVVTVTWFLALNEAGLSGRPKS